MKNGCFWTVVLEKTLESPLDKTEVKPVNPKGNQLWIFTGSTDAEAKAPIIWPSDMKSQLIGKDTDTRKYWGQEEKGVTEAEMVGWHHQLNGHEFGRLWLIVSDREAWHASGRGVSERQTRLSGWMRTATPFGYCDYAVSAVNLFKIYAM